ncbi:MAG: helix-turn-helix transcriptional regulator [Clostridia bacterium]|nr:helix-turn-helix transcriptional regulator [Clostridia bacterium]
MPYKLFNGNTNVVSNLITQKRKEKDMSYSDLSNKLQLLGISLYKNDLFLIEKNRRIVRDFELIALCQVLDINYNELSRLIEFDS